MPNLAQLVTKLDQLPAPIITREVRDRAVLNVLVAAEQFTDDVERSNWLFDVLAALGLDRA